MQLFSTVQVTLLLVLGVVALGFEVFALVDALRHRSDAYPAAGKRTKTFWLIVLAVAVAIGVITIQNVLGIGIIAFVAAAVYLADARPALRQVTGRGGSKKNQGPYGPW